MVDLVEDRGYHSDHAGEKKTKQKQEPFSQEGRWLHVRWIVAAGCGCRVHDQPFC